METSPIAALPTSVASVPPMRSLHRFFEILPATLTWLTFILMFVFSWFIPFWVAIFIILFDTYWLLKTIYLSFHLRATFTEMQRVIKVNWLEKLKARAEPRYTADVATAATMPAMMRRPSWADMYHLVILPMYNEPYEVVRESFASLAKINYPKERLFVVLALEEAGGDEPKQTAERLEDEFGLEFGRFMVTVHPSGLPGEIPGKGSNESWAGRHAKEKILDALHIQYANVLVSVFDVDTQVMPEYFARLTYMFLDAKNPLRAIYQPIPFLTNNIYEAPALARVVAFSMTFWQMMQQSRPERLTSFSSQSIPFQTLIDIGFWGRDIVSEDSRVFWQGYLAYHGDFRVEPLFYPISMDANVAPTFWGTMKNIYKQQRRWAWGAENIPYMMEGFRHDPEIPAAKKRYWTFNSLEGFHSWATNSLMIFALGWLPLWLGGKNFGASLLAYSLPHVTRWIVTLSMLGIVSSAILAIVLLPKKAGGIKFADYFIYFIQWALMPITLIVFGAFPAIEAQTRLALGGKYRLGFWVTPKSREKKIQDPNS
jgi:cellulose synthase/poly-beta-1,6-N-acetylglucosamine synthase-like glycosyltransferase